MTEEKMSLQEFHKKIAVDANNGVWPTLDKEDPSTEELEHALHLAHTSLYHWSKIGGPVNIARAEYMISRVCSALGWAEPALFHAERSLSICKASEVEDFDLAFAYEVMTRAYAVAKNESEFKKYYSLAEEAIANVENREDKTICQGELDKVTFSV